MNPRPSTSSGGRKNVLIPAGNNPLIPSFHPPFGTVLTAIHCFHVYIRIKVWIVFVVWMLANERGCSLDHSYWSAQLGCCIQRLRKVSGSDKLEARIAGTKRYGVKRDALRIQHVPNIAKMYSNYSGPSRVFRHASSHHHAKYMHWHQQCGHSCLKFTSLLQTELTLDDPVFEVCNIEPTVL
jgi:hypothetical protein